MNIDNCPICKKDWSWYNYSSFNCAKCELLVITYRNIYHNYRKYSLKNIEYTQEEFDKLLKLKAFW